MENIFIRGWEDFVSRADGPLNFRFLMQPVVAIILAVRSGLRDAREGKPAFLWAVFTKTGSRTGILRCALRDLCRVLILVVALDVLYQVFVLKAVYVGELLFTAFVLAVVPYILFRGPVNRIAQILRRTRKQSI